MFKRVKNCLISPFAPLVKKRIHLKIIKLFEKEFNIDVDNIEFRRYYCIADHGRNSICHFEWGIYKFGIWVDSDRIYVFAETKIYIDKFKPSATPRSVSVDIKSLTKFGTMDLLNLRTKLRKTFKLIFDNQHKASYVDIYHENSIKGFSKEDKENVYRNTYAKNYYYYEKKFQFPKVQYRWVKIFLIPILKEFFKDYELNYEVKFDTDFSPSIKINFYIDKFINDEEELVFKDNLSRLNECAYEKSQAFAEKYNEKHGCYVSDKLDFLQLYVLDKENKK